MHSLHFENVTDVVFSIKHDGSFRKIITTNEIYILGGANFAARLLHFLPILISFSTLQNSLWNITCALPGYIDKYCLKLNKNICQHADVLPI